MIKQVQCTLCYKYLDPIACHSNGTYTLKGGLVRVRYVCRLCTRARVKAYREAKAHTS